MMRAMYSGVSGLRAHQLKMDVIGNNIANVNTVGYKASRVTFAELYSQTLSGASSSTDSRGGTNATQIGLGTSVGAISVNQTTGSTQTTSVATDLMIDGEGYFMVTDDANAQNIYYTRAGDFSLDELGYLVTSSGMRVLDDELNPIQINMSDTKTATASTGISINGNLNFTEEVDADTNIAYTTTIDLYDSLGDTHTINVNFVGEPLTTDGAKTISDATIASYDPLNETTVAARNYSYREITITDPETGDQMIPDPTATPVEQYYAMFNEDGEIVDLVTLAIPGDTTTAETSVTGVTLGISVDGASDILLDIDRGLFFSNGNDATGTRTLSQYSQESDAKGVQYDGISAGTLSSFNISSKGEVTGIYTNGEQKILQTIGLASFDNSAGLVKIGSNLFQESPNSGTAKTGTAGTSSFGDITPGALEMSNVDLSAEFTEMITTQRGFQANSRVITTCDEILQELVNLK